MKFQKSFILIFFGVSILFAVGLYTTYYVVKEQTIRDMNFSQAILARQASTGIKDYVSNVTGTLNYLSRFPEIIKSNASGKQIMMSYQNFNSEEIKSITRVDAQGKIIFTFPYKESIGKDISYQDHVRLSIKTHKTVVSDVFMSIEGFKAVAVHVPVFKNGAFDGTLAFLLSFDKIAQNYIENIRVQENGFAWVVSEKGIEISSPFPDHIGKNVYDTYKNFPEIISMINVMQKENEGATAYHYYRNQHAHDKNILFHAVFMRIPLMNTFWSIVIATPEDEITATLSGFRTNLFLVTIALLLICMIFMYLVVRFQVIVGEQRKREKVLTELQGSESRYRYLFEQNPMPMLIYELDSLIILAVNDAFIAHYGYTEDEALTLLLTDLYQENERKNISDLSKELKGHAYAGEWHHLKKDGTKITIEAHSHGFLYEGRASRIAVINDVTERKRTEQDIQEYRKHLEKLVEERTAELLIAKERAESADRIKSSFLATMSHELRTPLNSIIGFTGILIQGLAGSLNNEQTKQLRMVQNSAHHLLDLINDVLDISKIEAGQLQVSIKRYNFHLSVERLIASIRPSAERKGLDIQTNISSNITELVSDSRRVNQILMNLLNNAIKFTDKGSICVTCVIEDKNLIISVTDTGIGIRKEDLTKLFVPFSQIDTGTARSYEGTGLGLSISKKLVEKLGGTITVQSTLGSGSTFRVTLPMIEG